MPFPSTAIAAQDQAFTFLLTAEQHNAIYVVPAELVTFHVIDLPVRSTRQRQAALPFALEERVGQPLEHVHFALCRSTREGKTLAAVVDAELMKKWVTEWPDTPLIPEQTLIPTGTSGVDGRESWRTYREGNRVLVRVSDGTGFVALADKLGLLWRAANKPDVENYGAPLPSEMVWTDSSDKGIPTEPALIENDLRQGIHRPSRGLWRPLKYLVASVMLAGIVHLAIAVADARAQRAIAEGLREQATTAIAARLPSVSVETAPEVILRQLHAQSRPQRGSSFLPLMDSVARALLGADDALRFRQLNWDTDGLRLTVEASDLDALQQAEARLKSAGLRVTSGSATADAGAARAELTVQR
ncbi:type II secretion system protein GspL [Sulfitobacter sp. F26204]|uniref:type II secretion system protein GspL n=1 Tax=Sulfitobacter sp. F26204 TaxID=2996014 RepID=UPI00225E3764|nr:type II secretion system protein GspL [Sulfitobacter sp. F26204]MCX7560527.1 type II secretion system protein GspL [Sulfitobacter sp. F26204]